MIIIIQTLRLTLTSLAIVDGGRCSAHYFCFSMERIYVAETVYDKFQSLCNREAAKYKVLSNGLNPSSRVSGTILNQVEDVTVSLALITLNSSWEAAIAITSIMVELVNRAETNNSPSLAD
jgi:acyl-CoA reductase-like NAD-dependent aldehyde dehydrogenase